MSDQTQPFNALILHRDDDVAVLIQDVAHGATVHAGGAKGPVVLSARQPLLIGHKLALHPMDADTLVRKYGAVIGRLISPVAEGDHIHVHNLVSLRANGAVASTAADTTSPVRRREPRS